MTPTTPPDRAPSSPADATAAHAAAAADSTYYSSVRRDVAPLLPAGGGTVLEIGCGAGATMSWLRGERAIRQAVGVELVAAQAELARSAFDEVLVGPIEARLPDLAGRRFDLVLALDVLEHLADPWSVLAALRRLQGPGGVLVVSVPNVSHYSAAFPLFFGGRWRYTPSGVLDCTHLRFFDRESACRLVSDAGWRVERVAANRRLPSPGLRLLGRRGRWYSGRALSLLLPRRFTDYQYLIRGVAA